MKKILLAATLALAGHASFAHPVSYKGALAVMTWNQPFLADNWIAHSLRPDMAVAARYMRMEMPTGRMHFYAPQFDYLVYRWNETHMQANIYVYGAAGGSSQNSNHGFAALGGVEADAESRSLFILAKGEWMYTRQEQYTDNYEFRLGAAPWESAFEELGAWLMLKFQYHPKLTRTWALTPMARLLYKSFLIEAGVSVEGDAMLNLMFHF